MIDRPEQKPKDKPDAPGGYSVATPRKRLSRPVHASRKAILEQAEALFAKTRDREPASKQ